MGICWGRDKAKLPASSRIAKLELTAAALGRRTPTLFLFVSVGACHSRAIASRSFCRLHSKTADAAPRSRRNTSGTFQRRVAPVSDASTARPFEGLLRAMLAVVLGACFLVFLALLLRNQAGSSLASFLHEPGSQAPNLRFHRVSQMSLQTSRPSSLP